MTKTSTFKFFVQEKVESGEISIEKTKEITAVINQPNPVSSNAQQTEQAHQAIRAVFDGLRQSARESHSPHHQANQGDVQAHAKDNQLHVLEVPAVTLVDKSVLAYLEAFFASDRSSSEILKLSNRLFNLGQAYNKTGK
ncbi:hypothetical protein [Haemophilus haemolyticus]|uniref:hypothetical protein n=1 Tax=Haemophilus haemolyticus TaxID=726 RepID=UPI00112A7CDB|nr:hypothetical protein [Haemophilus haemolyticus]TPH03962.1 hypothetical protein EUX51_03185 [Haemophilus haemolyticus]